MWNIEGLMSWMIETLPNASIGEDNDGQIVIYTNLTSISSDGHLLDMNLVTCDNCPATDEAGWGDTPLCLDCEDEKNICLEHYRTFVGECPLDH